MSINEIKNLDEAITLIQSLQNENARLKNKVEQQDVRISNLTEMLIKSQKKMFASPVSRQNTSTLQSSSHCLMKLKKSMQPQLLNLHRNLLLQYTPERKSAPKQRSLQM
ncbi:MAG: hypothetical protein K2I06_12530 [Ruminococcus sp.]|nr:hypothetical protein [Ruminococcus sp.]